MSVQIFYKNNEGETLGPFDVNQLKVEASSGNLLPENFVWQEGSSSSSLASNVKGLFPATDPPPLDHSAEINLNTPNNVGSSESSEPPKLMEAAKTLASSIAVSLRDTVENSDSNRTASETNKLSWAAMHLGRRITVVSTVVAILSMFFNWVDVGMASQTGFGQQAYLLLAFWIYPIFAIIKNKNLNFIGGIACSLGSTISVLAYLNSNIIEMPGGSISAGSTGAYLFLLASLGFTFAVFKYRN